MLAFLHCWQPANTARVSCPVQGRCRKAKKHYGSEGRIALPQGSNTMAVKDGSGPRPAAQSAKRLRLSLLSPAFLLAFCVCSYKKLAVFYFCRCFLLPSCSPHVAFCGYKELAVFFCCCCKTLAVFLLLLLLSPAFLLLLLALLVRLLPDSV